MTTARNDPCPCASGKKFKRCCLREESLGPVAAAANLRRLQDPLEERLLQFAVGTYGRKAVEGAWAEFAADREDLELEGSEAQLFWPWFLYGWRQARSDDVALDARSGHKTIAESFLGDGGFPLTEAERGFVEAVLRSPFSFHEVLECDPGRGVRMRDILLETQAEVIERSASRLLEVGDVVFARVVPFGDFALIVGSGSAALPPLMKQPILERRATMRLAGERLQPHLLSGLFPALKEAYFGLRARVLDPPAPRLCNTDGDPFLLHTIHYEVSSAEAAFEALKSLAATASKEDLEEEATRDASGRLVAAKIPWSKRGNKMHKGWENTIMGHVEIVGRRMTVTVNSARRAKRIQKEIEKRLGEAAVCLGTEVVTPEDMLAGQESPEEAARRLRAERESKELMSRPEVQEALREFAERHWKAWLHEKIPALGGKTPVEAVRDPEGREMVEALLVQYERDDRRAGGPALPVDYGRLRERLGLGPKAESSGD